MRRSLPISLVASLSLGLVTLGCDVEDDGQAEPQPKSYGGPGTQIRPDGPETRVPPSGEPVCGDGWMEGLEQCDDGNLINGDGCDADCGTAMILYWDDEHEGEPGLVDRGYGIARTVDGGLFVTGTIEGPKGPDGYVARYDVEGKLLWTDQFDGKAGGQDQFFGGACDDAGNCYAVGSTTPDIALGADSVIVKYEFGGARDWVLTTDRGDGYDTARTVAALSDGDMIVAGGARAPGGTDWDGWLIRIGGDETVRWSAQVAGDDGLHDMVYAVVADENDDIYVGGHVGVAEQIGDAWVARYDQDGNELWANKFNGVDYTLESSVRGLVATDDGVVLVGFERDDAGDPFGIARRYTADGERTWTSRLGPGTAHGALVTEDARVVVVGEATVDGAPRCTAASIAEETGDVVWDKTYLAPGLTDCGLEGVVAGESPNRMVTVGYAGRIDDPANIWVAEFSM